jgi:hypothetical protein
MHENNDQLLHIELKQRKAVIDMRIRNLTRRDGKAINLDRDSIRLPDFYTLRDATEEFLAELEEIAKQNSLDEMASRSNSNEGDDSPS